jgi:methanogenic corrinoid protein MtbC1
MNRLASEQHCGGSASEEECLREAAQFGLAVPPPGHMPGADDGSPSQIRLSRLMQTLERDVIPRLVQAHRLPAPPLPPQPEIEWPEVRGFARLSIALDGEPMREVVRGLCRAGCSVDRVFLELLSPTARELGRMWEDDGCNFTDVTVGVGRLQQLLRELSPAFGGEVGHPKDGRRILLLPAPGEQHTFGASMVAEFFRRAGWDVIGGVGGSEMEPVEMVRNEWFDILGLSAGHLARADWLRECVASVRRWSRNRDIGIMAGGPLFIVAPEVESRVGCDAVVVDGERAPERAETLLASRTRRG